MALKIPQKQPAKIVRSVRISPKAADILDEMVNVGGSTQALCIEELLTTFGPEAIKEAMLIKAAGKK